MKYTEIKELINEFDRSAAEDIIANLGSNDFEVDRGYYRFIREDAAEQIAYDMLESDTYILGCFNPDFIADNTILSYDIVKALQEGEQFVAIGQHILDNDDLDGIVSEYIRLDGYGHVFGSYDGDYEEIAIDGIDYIYFRQ